MQRLPDTNAAKMRPSSTSETALVAVGKEKEVEGEDQSPNPPTTTVSSAQQQRQMARLKDAVLQIAISRGSSLSTQKSKHIEDHLRSLFPSGLSTPTHPPYAEMIIAAIRELKKKGGSNEASISSYIESNYQDLPWAHSRYLSHHLEKLVERGEIITAFRSRYVLPNPNQQQRRRRKHRRGRLPKKCEPEQQIVVTSEMIESRADDDVVDGSMVLPNKDFTVDAMGVGPVQQHCRPEHIVVPSEMMRSRADDDVDDGSMVLPNKHFTVDAMEVGPVQQQQQRKLRGRPPMKRDPDQNVQLARTGTMRSWADDGSIVPPNRPTAAVMKEGGGPSQQEQNQPKRKIRPESPAPTAVMEEVRPPQQQQKRRGRGRPPKPKPDGLNT